MKSPEKKIAAIILAAGGSSRMGQPKLLLDWHGQPLIHWVARLALSAGCTPVVVVTGADAKLVMQALAGLPLLLTHNPAWQKGQSSSVQRGVNALPEDVDAALVFLGDQPHIPVSVPHELIRVFIQEEPTEGILIPTVDEKRANPVLLARCIFEPLQALRGDVGARMLFSKYPVRMIPFDEADLLLDIDSAADYQKLMEKTAPLLED